MKKALSLLLALMLLLTLCACGNDDPSTEPETNPSTENTTAETKDTTPSTEAPTECTHDYTEAVTKEATCAEEGVKTFTCSKCGDSYTEAIEKSDHSYTEAITKEATCAEEGVKTYTCAGCGDSYTESIAKVAHNWKSATCTAPKTCTSCGATEGSAAGHNWKNATCTAPKTCTTCGATEGKKASHSYTDGVCSNCGQVDLETYVVGKWSVDKVYDKDADQITINYLDFRKNGTCSSYESLYQRIDEFIYKDNGIYVDEPGYLLWVGDTEVTSNRVICINDVYYVEVWGVTYFDFSSTYKIEGNQIKVSCYIEADGLYYLGDYVFEITDQNKIIVVKVYEHAEICSDWVYVKN